MSHQQLTGYFWLYVITLFANLKVFGVGLRIQYVLEEKRRDVVDSFHVIPSLISLVLDIALFLHRIYFDQKNYHIG